MHVLYRCMDESGQPLYIGRTTDPGTRLRVHEATAPWWRAVAEVRLEHFGDAETLAEAERTAIRNECPGHNITYADLWEVTPARTEWTRDGNTQFFVIRCPFCGGPHSHTTDEIDRSWRGRVLPPCRRGRYRVVRPL